MKQPYYGVYLIPPPHLLQPLAAAHNFLASEFNAQAAGRFMVHCTVKGFTRLSDGSTPTDFIPALDRLFADTPAFPTGITEVKMLNFGPERISVLLEMAKTDAFDQFQQNIWEVLKPYTAPDCLFTPGDPFGPNFRPHISLVQYDGPSDPGLLTQLTDYCQYLFENSLQGKWFARDMQLIEFHSQDWPGEWWHTLQYQQLKGWRLPDKAGN